MDEEENMEEKTMTIEELRSSSEYVEAYADYLKSEILGNNAPFLPYKWVFENYPNGWQGSGSLTFATYFRNSIIVSCLATLGTVISSAMVSYALARINFRGRKFWFTAMIGLHSVMP